MRIDIVGGGPAGLYLAYLLKQDDPDHRVRVFERNAADVTYGWGVVFSGRALGFIEERSEQLFEQLDQALERWTDLTIVHRDQAVAIDGSEFSGISRQRLLDVLQIHCTEAGVELFFSTSVNALPTDDDTDLLIGADGVGSMVRHHNEQRFGTSTTLCTNRYIWYGTTRVFDTLSLIFKSNDDGVFVAHTYRYSPNMSTFLVECDADTYASAGFAQMTDQQSRAYCENVFAEELRGEALQSNHSEWRQFPVITNENWFQKNTLLIGDALRTVHFSIGSGTRTAMEDAIVLADSIAANRDSIDQSLEQFVARRRPQADKLERIASESIAWYEDFRQIMHLGAHDFAMNYMLRGGELNLDAMEKHAPRFVQNWRRHSDMDAARS